MPRVQKSKGVVTRSAAAAAAVATSANPSTPPSTPSRPRRVRKYPGLLHPDSCLDEWSPHDPHEEPLERLAVCPIAPVDPAVALAAERFAQGLKELGSAMRPMYCVGDVVRALPGGNRKLARLERHDVVDMNRPRPLRTRVGEITRVFVEDGTVQYELKQYIETRASLANSRTQAAIKLEASRKADLEANRLRPVATSNAPELWAPGEEWTTMVVPQERIIWRLAIPPNCATTSGAEIQDAVMASSQDYHPLDSANDHPSASELANRPQEPGSVGGSLMDHDHDEVHDISPEGSPIPIYLIPAVNERVHTFVRKLKAKQIAERGKYSPVSTTIDPLYL